ncbi:regulator of G-protein signaling 20-like isoform X2 [Chiloscyllium plagiosum]|uniref:regulator of G-protein signaling 20-like isoform X2 n=1 Tax=Chiloscyllium plagiosum TaxID=36176 RepID=UPI001CB83ACB|nr:regulator of G-protein signaling 20-like isoform X2 [Chiloscyllium plagiosum]
MWRRFFTRCRARHYAEGCQATEIIQIENEQRNEGLQLLKPMGSERMEMRKRQTLVQQEMLGSAQPQQGDGNRGSNACCFCWCCCCSCSCLTVRNEDDERARRMSQEARGESLPNCEERQWWHPANLCQKQVSTQGPLLSLYL